MSCCHAVAIYLFVSRVINNRPDNFH